MVVDFTNLSVAERIQLVEDLWDSIAAAPIDVAVTQAQKDELDRRLRAYTFDPSVGKTWQQVKDGLKQRSQP